MDLRVNGLRRIRYLPRPEDGLRALVQRAPQAEAALDRLRDRFRPSGERLYKVRRQLATAAVGVLTVWLFLHVMFSDNGMVAYKEKRAEIEVLRKDVDSLQHENDIYTQQIKALKSDPKAIEKEAREQLHYARPGEVIYVSPPAVPPPAKPVTNSAKKSN
ncbi:MAG TPA: septum formation initiator family protein [Terriglobales bacterium]